MKKIILLVLSFCLFLVCCSCSQETDFGKSDYKIPETPVSEFEFRAGNTGYIVTKYLGTKREISIPSTYENKKVVDLDNTVFAGNIAVEKISLSEHMSYIDLNDFVGCEKLEVVIYPGNVTSVKSTTGPEKLTTLALPNTTDISNLSLNVLIKTNPSIKNLDISSATLKRDENYNYLEGLNIKISESQFSKIKDMTLYPYDVSYSNTLKLDKKSYSYELYSLIDEYKLSDPNIRLTKLPYSVGPYYYEGTGYTVGLLCFTVKEAFDLPNIDAENITYEVYFQHEPDDYTYKYVHKPDYLETREDDIWGLPYLVYVKYKDGNDNYEIISLYNCKIVKDPILTPNEDQVLSEGEWELEQKYVIARKALPELKDEQTNFLQFFSVSTITVNGKIFHS